MDFKKAPEDVFFFFAFVFFRFGSKMIIYFGLPSFFVVQVLALAMKTLVFVVHVLAMLPCLTSCPLTPFK